MANGKPRNSVERGCQRKATYVSTGTPGEIRHVCEIHRKGLDFPSGSGRQWIRIKMPRIVNPEWRRAYAKKYVARRLAVDAKFREERNRSARTYRKSTREWLANYKMERGCIDCGFKAHFTALQLDHEGPKSIEISAARTSITRLKAEIEAGRCVVRCANCHSIRTWERKCINREPLSIGGNSIGRGCEGDH